MSSFREKLKKDEFVLTTELFPPRGPDVQDFLKKAVLLKGHFDAYNVTDNQRAIMRLSPVACSLLLLQQGLDPVLQLTCRDRNRLALQSELLGAQMIGARNVLALTGDYITAGDHPQAKPVFDLDSVQLLQMIQMLNEGKNFSGTDLNGRCDFFAGAAINPAAEPRELVIESMKKKIRHGACFFQSQAIFNFDHFSGFCREVKEFTPKIIAGIFLLKSAKNARFLNQNVPGISIPEKIIELLEKSSQPLEEGISYAADLVSMMKSQKICSGVHIMCIGMEEISLNIIRKAGISK
jgi:methylenetetrahydrofolate reductase (NADPH)